MYITIENKINEIDFFLKSGISFVFGNLLFALGRLKVFWY